MNELVNEKVSVLLLYDRETGNASPMRLKWQGKVHKIKKVGIHYPVRMGRKLLHYFGVITENNTSFKLKLDTEKLHWTLEEVIDEFAD